MPAPTHGPFCQTHVFPTSCWYCQQSIHVLQCSCGSAVLFDRIGHPWPKHACDGTGGAGGIGGSGLSGWEAVDALRAQGAPISRDVLQKIFPSEQRPMDRKTRPSADIKRIEPMPGHPMDLLAVVRELHAKTKRTLPIKDFSAMGMKLVGLDPKVRYWQVTLVQNNIRPNESYTALVPEHLTRGLSPGMMVMVGMSAKIQADYAFWVVSNIDPL